MDTFSTEECGDDFTSAFHLEPELTAVLVPSTVSEGESVRLICRSGCGGSPSTVWFRDGQPVQESDFQVSREDAGKYHCAIRGQESVISASVTLNVQCKLFHPFLDYASI